MCLGWWKTVFIVWCAMARVWTLFDKLSAIWGLFISLSMDLGAQSAAGCWSDCVKSGHGVSCPSLSQSSAAGVSTGLVWVGRTWAGAQKCLSLVLGQPACPWQEMLVTVSNPPWDCTFLPLSSYGDKNHLRIRRCLISTLLRISKNNSHKKLILFLPIIGTNKLVFKLFSFSLCSNLGKFSNNFVCCLLYLGHWSNASTGMKN